MSWTEAKLEKIQIDYTVKALGITGANFDMVKALGMAGVVTVSEIKSVEALTMGPNCKKGKPTVEATEAFKQSYAHCVAGPACQKEKGRVSPRKS